MSLAQSLTRIAAEKSLELWLQSEPQSNLFPRRVIVEMKFTGSTLAIKSNRQYISFQMGSSGNALKTAEEYHKVEDVHLRAAGGPTVDMVQPSTKGHSHRLSMVRLNFKTDEATLLKAYGISSLTPTRWEEIDHELEDSLAGALTGSSTGQGAEGDPLGIKPRINLRDMDLESKASVLISSKSFDPKAFLSVVHPNATYQDLTSGINHLLASLESRSEAIRILVEESFDRFVAVKASTDALHSEMKEGLLSPTAEFGSRPIREHLKLGAQKADQVFLPVLENASKAAKLRTTLGVIERSKFFFNLPGSLVEIIDSGRYDVALRDYKKGKFLLESRPGQLLPLPVSTTVNAKEVEAHQKRILEKVWANVEKVMAEMRNLLLGMLRDETRSVEEQEKTIEILSELSTGDDPAWSYFDAQHKYIMGQMNTVYQSAVANIKVAHKRTTMENPEPGQLRNLLVNQLRVCVSSIDSKTTDDSVIAQSGGHEVWTGIGNMVKNVSDTMLTHLPNFWKVSKSFLDGRFKRPTPGGGTRRSPTQVRTMALDMVKLYISLLSEFFLLSDMAVLLTSRTSGNSPPLLPSHSNLFTTGHYLTKILGDVQDTINEINGMDISNEAANGLKALLESARWRFVEILNSAWMRDAKNFHFLETWATNPSEPSTTLYLNSIELFQRYATTSAFKLSGGVDLSSSLTKTVKQNVIAPPFMAKITKAFIDAMYTFLDGFVGLAFDEQAAEVTFRPSTEKFPKGLSSNTGANKSELLDLRDMDTRLLLVISNLGYVTQVHFPNMITQFETAFGLNIEEERNRLLQVAQQFDNKLFDEYIKPKTEALLAIVRDGILGDTIDWFETPQPTEIRPFMFETLLYLVKIHAQVNATAEMLLDRILCTLVDALAEDALRAFRTVDRFGMAGMLRATLEIEFMHQTLSRYVTPAAAKTLSQVYSKISQAYTRRPGDENLQGNLDGVKKILAEARRATGIEFLCFRQTKEKHASNKASNVPMTPKSARASGGQ